MAYPTYIPMQQPTMQPMVGQGGAYAPRPMMQPQPMIRPMYGSPQSLIRVNGQAGADAYYLDAPNSEVALFDANEDVFYVKTTDGGGFPSMRAFRFEPVPESGTYVAELPVSREEFEQLRNELNELKGALTNAKQPVRAAKGAKTAGAGGEAEE